ncbi:hypothetical protein HU739_003760 [Pseudomonas hamedanensis]|uniref:Uncharacterized protein n=1 Tax=Pseudomonas hamedanensis TaxID=2745504 RepID=A0A9E6P5J2_9PSED|nr:hypothetical protein HU739_003760 [Pseudomonas hamedanensis]
MNKLTLRGEKLQAAQPIALEGAYVSLEPDSTLEDTLQPGRDLLRKLHEAPSFQKLRAITGLPDHSTLDVTDAGEFIANNSGKRLSYAAVLKLAPDLKEDFSVLVEMAKRTGGRLSLSDSIELGQWLKFHGYTIPKTVGESRKLTNFMKMKPPVSPSTGNYWELIRTQGNAVTLAAAQRAQFRKLIATYLKGDSLLEHLSDSVLGGRSAPVMRSEAEETLIKLVSSPIGSSWAQAFVRDLDWYGANAGQTQTTESLQMIMLTSLLLDLHPDIGEQEPRNHIAGFNLYAVEFIEKTFAQVQTEFESHLNKYHRVSKKNVALAAHLLLAQAAPEFLVRDLPSTLLLGTPQWVEFCRVVAVLEIMAPGSTRLMTYEEVQRWQRLDSVHESQKTLDALAAVDPLLDWALFNKLLQPDEISKTPEQSLEKAVAAYARPAKTLAKTAEILSRPLPSRKSISLEILKHVAQGCTYLEEEVMTQKRNRPLEDAYSDVLMSPVELHMSNDLATGDWDRKKGESIYKTFPFMSSNLISPDGEFHRRFNSDYVTHTKALHQHVKAALSSLPLPARRRLLKGQLTLFIVRPTVAKLQDRTPIKANPLATTIDAILQAKYRTETESHVDIEQATGRYGVIIGSQFENTFTCYELFTLHGGCRENTELAAFIQRENLVHATARSDKSKHSLPAKVHQIPTNIECYTHGVPPGLVNNSRGIIERIAVLSTPPLSPDAETQGYYQSFYSNEFDALANLVLKHRPIATYDELVRECWGQTRLEAIRAKRNKDLDTFLNFVVPFKSCIEDLTSDDLNRQLDGVAACTLEAAMTVLLMIGAVAQVATIAARSMTNITKASAIAKAGLGLFSNLLNPLDGATDLLVQGSKLLHKGLNKSLAVLENTVSELRRLSGAKPYHQLAGTLDSDVIRLGTWRPVQTSQDVFQVWGIRRGDDWYAVNRLGQPWGAKLDDLQFKFGLPALNWRKIMPKGYTHGYLKKALPVAKGKLDEALFLLADAESNSDIRRVFSCMFGTDSDEAIQHVQKRLREMRKDLDSFSLANIAFKKTKVPAVAALNVPEYKAWKKAVIDNKIDKNSVNQFIDIYPDHLDHFYRSNKYDESRVADVLIHEMSHGAPGTLDLYYGAPLDHALYNAAPLVDLARNPRMADPSFINPYPKAQKKAPTHLDRFVSVRASLPPLVREHPALYNADSYEVAVSLIHQLKSDPPGFSINMATIERALKTTDAGEFIGRLEVSLGKTLD